MYDRYKSRNRSKKASRVFLLIALISFTGYLGYQHRSYLLFWKFTYNKLVQKIDTVSSLQRDRRDSEYREHTGICRDYIEDNRLSEEAYLLAGRVHFLLAKTLIKDTFSELIIYDRSYRIPADAKDELHHAVKNIRKGIALSRDEIDSNYRVILAKAFYYLDYYPVADIVRQIQDVAVEEIRSDTESVRFYGLMHILNGSIDKGISVMKAHGHVTESIEGMLFMAAANMLAQRYTVAIMEYRQVLDKTSDNAIMKLAHIRLGKIFYNQSLYTESLSHFSRALAIDERDNELKIWIGKNYSALGDKTRARAIWSEVLASDSNNAEVRKLLGMM